MRLGILVLVFVCGAARGISIPPFISELHYDNQGVDVNEFVEISGANVNLNGWDLAFYNGATGLLYQTLPLLGQLSDVRLQAWAFFPAFSIQNGPSDGIALVDSGGNVVDFVSYEGSLQAVNGPAATLTAQQLPVVESASTPDGYALQRTSLKDPAQWRLAPTSAGHVNVGLLPLPGTAWLFIIGFSWLLRRTA